MIHSPNIPRLHRTLGLLSAALLSIAASSAHAQDTSRIARVTVYPGSATVERVAKVPAGARSLTLACLPASLDVQSLQINADPAVRVGEFNVLTEDRDVVSACASPLDGRIRELEDQIAGVKAEASALQLVDGYLRSVANAGAVEDAARRIQSPTPAQIAATAEVLRKSGQDSFARTHQLARKQEALELALKPLVAERDRVASQRARVVSVTINLATEREAELRLSYQVRGPGWQPTYRATLDADKSTVLIERQALVAQNSGEDWSHVQLTLSTGQPGRATQGRLPRAWTLDVAPPPQPRATAAPVMAMSAAEPPAPSPLARDKSAEASMPSFDVSAIDKGFATEFAVPQRITVPSSGQRVTLALGSHAAPATLITRTAPALEEAAYLLAQIAQPPGVWPAGPAGLYRDGAFVGNGRIDFGAASAGAPAGGTSLSFGRDELVTVRAEPVQDMTGSAGFTGSRTERKTRRAYSVENRHKSGSITLQVLHAAPVSRNEKIEVESRYQPQPADMAWNRTPGTVAWQQPLAAGATAHFSAEHTIRYPKDIELLERQ